MRAQRPPLTPRHLRRPGELFGWILNRPSRRQVKVATSLRFLHEVLGLEHLHYGLWDGEPSTLAGLRTAQARFSELLLAWIPEGVRRILDVGAGVGTDALELTRRGYEVEGLSPDPYQQHHFVERTGLPFHLTRLQDFTADEPYDLILMSESAQYIWVETIFDKVRELAPRGYLLLADYFLVERRGPSYRKAAHPLPEFLERAAATGFRLQQQEDITAAVLPTLELANSWIERFVDPTVQIAADSFRARRPRLFTLTRPLVRWALARSAASRRQIDPEEFARTKRYLLMLWQADAAGLQD